MTVRERLGFWAILAFVFFLLFVYLLGNILAPFVAGMLIAYLLDPLADRLERWMPRGAAAILLIVLAILGLCLILLLLLPLIETQISRFLQALPGYLQALQSWLAPLLDTVEESMSGDKAHLQKLVTDNATKVLTGVVGVLRGVVTSGAAIANVLSMVFITPIVAFYLLRDWDRIVATVDRLLPLRDATAVRRLAGEIDETLAGFVRGQASVCLTLGSFYAVGLIAVRLEFGLVIGLVSGLLSFIPYVGTITGAVLSIGLAFAQFDETWRIVAVIVIFVIGQVVEGNYLTPKLVGDRVGLHPVWVIFALLAGGALFGFVGVLLAVPVAAAIGVLVRFAVEQYRESVLYSQHTDGTGEPGA